MCRMEVVLVLVLTVLAATTTRGTAAPTNDLVANSANQTPSGSSSSVASVPKPQVYQLKVRTDIRSRYARTLVTSRLANPADRAQEVTFQVTIPESAFISKFIMEVDGELMEGVVRERAVAKQEYQQAVQSGQTAGHVATASVRDSSHVRISVNVAAHAKASFNLTYEELLVRRKGRYELAVNLSPGQLVREMAVDVYIQETRNITHLVVPAFRSSNEIDFDESQSENPNAVVEWVSGRQAHVHFAPTVEQQRLLGAAAGKEEQGLGGQFIVRYDVERDTGAGEVLALDGYFVHFFSPPELAPLPKHVIFVLDVSGSMHGRKIEQLREAMDAILGELRPEDYFNLIEFSSSVTVMDLESPANSTVIQPSEYSNWQFGTETEEPKKETPFPSQFKAFPASQEFVTKARDAVRKMSAGGGTNIHDAVRAALGVAKDAVSHDGSASSLPEPLVIFLTDGEATVGHTRADSILGLIREHSNEKAEVPLFSLAFGQDADLAFLKRLSLRAGAFARKIYEAADAALQLRDFYRQVASPLLANVTFRYSDKQVDGSSITKKQFSLLFSGSELVVAGKLREANTDTLLLDGGVRGSAEGGDVEYSLIDDERLPSPGVPISTPPPQPGDRFLERLWAYLSIKQLLEQYDAERAEDDAKEGTNVTTPAQAARSKALDLALKFSFVTPVTSLVVVKSNDSATPSVTPTESNAQSESLPAVAQLSTTDVVDYAGGHSSFSLPAHHRYPGQSSGAHAWPASASAGFAGPPSLQASPGRPSGYRPAPISTALPQAPQGYPGPPPQPIPVMAEEEVESESLDFDSDIITEPATRQFNLTLVDVSALSWLDDVTAEVNNTSNPWRTVRVGNSSQTYKLLTANQSNETAASECQSPTMQDSHCRPLADCALAEFADDATLYLDIFACFIGTDRYLGACCPDSINAPVTTSHTQTAVSSTSPAAEVATGGSSSATPPQVTSTTTTNPPPST